MFVRIAFYWDGTSTKILGVETPEVSDAETKHCDEIGLTADGVCRKTYVPDQIKADEESRRVDFTISTGALDRDNDTIKVDGWDLENYRKNPVVLWAHNSWEPPVAKAVKVTKSGGALKATAEFVPKGVYPLADTVFEMLKGGFLRATSVGFRPKRGKDGQYRMTWNEQRGGFDFEEQELLEFSVVPVPSNPEALMTLGKDFAGAAAAGIDLDPMRKALALSDYAQGSDASMASLKWSVSPMADVIPAGTVAELVEKAMAEIKAGRRLSAKTEASLRSAHKSATEAVDHLTSVLGDCEDEMDDKTAPVLLVTPSPEPAKFIVNPDDVRAAVVAAVTATVRAEVNRLSGRLD